MYIVEKRVIYLKIANVYLYYVNSSTKKSDLAFDMSL